VGIGYRAQLQGKAIQLALVYSHPVIFPLPEGIGGDRQADGITLRGADKACSRDGRQAAPLASPIPTRGRHPLLRRVRAPQRSARRRAEMITRDAQPARQGPYRLRAICAARRRDRGGGVPEPRHIYAQLVDDDAGRTVLAADSRARRSSSSKRPATWHAGCMETHTVR